MDEPRVITTRGLKQANFSVGEKILCYEPDVSKARVLYDSKILDVDWTRDEKGKRIPEYLVHFNGWNSSWDRWAPEEYVLKHTEENVDLQHRLQEDAREKLKKKKKPSLKEKVDAASGPAEEEESNMETDYTSSVSDEDSNDSSSDDEEETEVPIIIPAALISKLEEDCYTINCKHKLVKLPCTPTVLTILEDYIKYFAVSIDKQAKSVPATYLTSAGTQKEIPQPPAPTNNLKLCKEVMDGLRIMFDFMLPACLLYLPEKKQYEVLVAKKKVTTQDAKSDENGAPAVKGRKRSRKSSSGSISPPVLEPQVAASFDIQKPEETETTRRITRRLSSSGGLGTSAAAHSEGKKKSTESSTAANSSAARLSSSVDHSPQKKGRQSLRHSSRLALQTSCPPDISQDKETPISHPSAAEPIKSEKLEAKQTLSSSASSRDKKDFGDAKQILQAACFMLVPENASLDGHVLPSKMYGMHHLLRLFVKLPELLGKMEIPPKKLKPLQKHLNVFLRYLASPKGINELFNSDSYVDWAAGF
ncbi:male-specific lethal 3 homolog [Anneissia japonica]|uniref:male-specific lethal 3 homolog n=1 Tax=Anneissia japonica TaxID=1529436 RepID=UPI0014257442|nr:male-specific lethal 3 homolog [Anneissia japonica]